MIAREEHVLITAPTGSGKTLCAFLWAINELVCGHWETGKVRLLYISPLKALNNDIQKNLLKPLTELQKVFETQGEAFPNIRVQTRSGDTPGNERRKMMARPPEILITTPESLNIMLTSKYGQAILSGLHTVILDEIHAVASSKRGTLLISGIERLTLLAGEFQRIALSATVNPLALVADFVGGNIIKGHYPDQVYEKRQVKIITSEISKEYEVTVQFPENASAELEDDSWWPALIRFFKEIIEKNKSTLFFVNSRTLSEKITRFINEGSPVDIAYAHHGSLSKEIRLAVEHKLKKGELKAIIATNSLELGIDVGDLDEVVMVQVPFSLSSAIQRTGRAGHHVGQKSRARIIPIHGREFIDAALTARAIRNKDIEALKIIDSPLDVLAQIILSMSCHQVWELNELFSFLKTIYSFQNLSRRQYDLVIEMLAGRYADSKINELKARISLDKLDNTLIAKDSVPYLIYTSGGTIPDRGYFNLRHQESKSKIGELDEEFVWERSIGDTFVLGSQIWQIQRINANDVEVMPTERPLNIIPFWKAENTDRDFYYSEKISTLLEEVNSRLNDEGLGCYLEQKFFMEKNAVTHLLEYLNYQKESTQCDLPHRHHLLIEHYEDALNKSDRKQVVLHTLWGGRVNRPLALALSAAWQDKYQYPLQYMANNDAILFMLPHEFSIETLLNLVNPENLEYYLRMKLEDTGFFGTRFRENAGRALLLPSSGFHKRLPLWLNRLRSKKLFEAVKKMDNFPIVLETWRSCLQDEFDLASLKNVLDELHTGKIVISECTTKKASPFCGNIIFRQINQFMYDDDSPLSKQKSNLSDDLIKEIMVSHLRPQIPIDIIRVLSQKLKQTFPGYAPGSTQDLLDLIKDRLIIPESEWLELIFRVEQENGLPREDLVAALKEKLMKIGFLNTCFILAIENFKKLMSCFKIERKDVCIQSLSDDPDTEKIEQLIRKNNINEQESDYQVEDFLTQWVSYYAVISQNSLLQKLPFNPELIQRTLDELRVSGTVIVDYVSEGSTQVEISDIRNLEILLRLNRKKNEAVFQAMPSRFLSLFLAHNQGLTHPGDSMEDLQSGMECLFGYPLAAGSWEETLLPSRLSPYFSNWLDALFSSTSLTWFGVEKNKIAFAFHEDLELFLESRKREPHLDHLFPGNRGKYGFFELTEFSRLNSTDLTRTLWEKLFKGQITNDNFNTLRQGIVNQYSVEELKYQKTTRRSGFNRWKASRPMTGNWSILERDFDLDPLEDLEVSKDRVRQLLNRYGLIFKALLDKEMPLLKWKALFRTLKIMELSGEIITGRFFEDIPGVQFTNHEGLRNLKRTLNVDSIYWVNAMDPASLCGIKIDTLRKPLPPRVASTFLVYHGADLKVIAKKTGRDLTLNFEPDSTYLSEYLKFFKILLTRSFNPENKITVESINGEKATKSVFLEGFKQFGFIASYRHLELWRKY